MNTQKRLDLFHQLLSCSYNLYSWVYDTHFEILSTNCDHPGWLDGILSYNNTKSYILDYAKANSSPLILSGNLGTVWVATFEKKKEVLQQIHIIGPAFTSDISPEYLESILHPFNLSLLWKKELIQILTAIPIVPFSTYIHCALMFHLVITDEKLGPSDINYQSNEFTSSTLPTSSSKDRSKTWLTEQLLLNMIREGNLNYQTILSEAANVSSGVGIQLNNPLRQAKDSSLIFTSLCTRAAIEGGLSPESAYILGDFYIQNAENCSNISEIITLNHTMYEDFIKRVHKLKTSPNTSKLIQSCCDYIDIHIQEKLSIKSIASRVGYTEYYLTRKFKKEIGYSINTYIKHARIKHSKILLTSTQLSIQEISDELHFCSRSYFADTFRKTVGISPTDYRLNNQKI